MIAMHDWIRSPGHREVVASFGTGRLVQVSRLRLEFQGGSHEDEIEARSWVALFMPETVVTSASVETAQRQARQG